MITITIKTSKSGKNETCSVYFHSCDLIDLCQSCQIWKKAMKDLKSQYTVTICLIFIFRTPCTRLPWLEVSWCYINYQHNFWSWSLWKVLIRLFTACKVSKYGVFSDPYFPVFSPNTGKYRPDKTPHLDIFYAVILMHKRAFKL